LDGEVLPVDYAANVASLGAHVIRANNRVELEDALHKAQQMTQTVCIVVETDRRQRVAGYESWWDVAIAEVSDNPAVQDAREGYEAARDKENYYL
jgi:3D-(3,5/4)-trihydroxycyclohexane-1,2-dione acylhydrolase (decyclizing)